MIKKNRARRHKQNVSTKRPRLVMESKSDLVIVVEDLRKTRRETVHVQRIIQHLTQQTSEKNAKEMLE